MITRLLLFNVFLLCYNKFSCAQTTFQKLFLGSNTEYGYSIIETTDGGYVIAGITSSYGAGGFDVSLVKLNANGDSLWTNTYGGVDHDHANSVRQTSDGGFIISGSTESFGAGMRDVFLLKTDSIGNFVWSRTFGGVNEDYGTDVRQTQDGGYIVVGSTSSFGAGGYDVYVIKTDANGDSLWTATAGGTDNDLGNSVDETVTGLYIITGSARSFGAGSDDIYLIQMIANGFFVWTKTYGNAGVDIGTSVHQTTDGGYVLLGSTSGSGTGRNIYLMKTDFNGDSLWTKTFGGINDDFGGSVLETSDAGYIITGWTSSFGAGNADIYLIKTDSAGNHIFSKTIGESLTDNAYDGIQTSDGGYFLCGYSTSFGSLTVDMYIIKTDSLGNSGCNTGNALTNTYSTTMQITNPPTLISSSPTIVTDPLPVNGSNAFIFNLCSTIGLNEIPVNNILYISPNPSLGNFTVTFKNIIQDGRLEIMNILGETIHEEIVFNTLKADINLNRITAGIYFVKVFDGIRYMSSKIIIR